MHLLAFHGTTMLLYLEVEQMHTNMLATNDTDSKVFLLLSKQICILDAITVIVIKNSK